MGDPEDLVHGVTQGLQIVAQHRVVLKVTVGTTIRLLLKITEFSVTEAENTSFSKW